MCLHHHHHHQNSVAATQRIKTSYKSYTVNVVYWKTKVSGFKINVFKEVLDKMYEYYIYTLAEVQIVE